MNASRGLSHQLASSLTGDEHAARRTRYAQRFTAFPVELAAHLRWLANDEGGHRLQAFEDILGGCERIRNTPIPFSCSSYIKKFVVPYALIMPFRLVREFGYGTVIASMFTFFATMGLELLATEVEEPFGTDINDLPLDTIGGVIARDAKAILSGS